MIAALLLALMAPTSASAPAAAETYDPSLDPVRYDGCVRAIAADAPKVEQYAGEWLARGGGLPARHCMALAQLHQGKNAEAAATLATAAGLAEKTQNPLAADFWSQAGNAALLASDSARATADLSAAIRLADSWPDRRRAGLFTDRARAEVDQQKLAEGRRDLDRALQLAPDDADTLLLSAALARRQQDLPRARADLTRAAARAPGSADILFEEGNLAAAGGDLAAARRFWEQARQKGGEAGRLAGLALSDHPAP